MAVGDADVFPGFLTQELTRLFFSKPPTTFLTYFCRGERRKYAGKKSHLNRGSSSQPPGHESDTLTTQPPGRGLTIKYRWYFVYVTLTLSQTTLVFTCLQDKSFENTVGKRRNCTNTEFLIFHNVFYSFGELSAVFIKFEIVLCKLFQFRRAKNLPFGRG